MLTKRFTPCLASNVFLELTLCAIFSCVSVKVTLKSFGGRFGNGYSPFYGTSEQIRLLQKANQGITDFIQSNYARVVADLKRNIRIFTSANSVVFGFLCDIIFKRVRITTGIVNAFLEAVGSVASAVPC